MADNALLTQILMREIQVAAAKSGNVLTPMHTECLHMIMGKVSRMTVGDQFYADNPHDIAGYATLLEAYINDFNTEEE
tara:strand:- start:9742 stop:9975 length:234 start_codon:yes stop_codon:yes gene_type:complete